MESIPSILMGILPILTTDKIDHFVIDKHYYLTPSPVICIKSHIPRPKLIIRVEDTFLHINLIDLDTGNDIMAYTTYALKKGELYQWGSVDRKPTRLDGRNKVKRLKLQHKMKVFISTLLKNK